MDGGVGLFYINPNISPQYCTYCIANFVGNTLKRNVQEGYISECILRCGLKCDGKLFDV
jgi:hypothetical protein